MTVAAQEYAPLFASLGALRAQLRDQPLVLDDVCVELLPALREEILALNQRWSSERSLNRGGWKSSEAFFQVAGPAAAALERVIVTELLGGRRPIGWAMVNANGSEHPRHQHTIASVVGIYYVTAGDPIVPTIYEVGAVAPMASTGRKATRGVDLPISPQPGRLVLCTGDTWHRVPRYDGTAPRVTIAFDVRR